jgi:acyl-CoA dehydrogenase
MDFAVPQDAQDVSDALLSFIDRYVVPLEERHRELLESERNRYAPDGRLVPGVIELRRQVRLASAAAGFYTLFADESLGGGGMDEIALVHIQERLNWHTGPYRPLIHENVVPSVFTNGLSPILHHLRPEVLAKHRDRIASGEATLCFALSEPAAGSDASQITTRAERTPSGWRLNGEKQWISNAAYADLAIVFAVTDPQARDARRGGVTGFLVDTRTAGFDVSSQIPVMGHLGSEISTVTLIDVEVPDNHVIGELNGGLRLAMSGIGKGRLSMASMCVGLAGWALEKSVDYANSRRSFGTEIGNHQAVQIHLAEMAMDIYAVKSLVARTAWLVSTGQPTVKETSIAKAAATEMLGRVMDSAMQVHGAMGLTNELRLEEGYRFARTLRIPDGTSEIQRRTIARRLLAGETSL